MHDATVRREALRLLADGLSVSAAARSLGVSRAAVRAWRDSPGVAVRADCPVCAGRLPAPAPYAGLLGYYLGDGCISAAARYHFLRVSCDRAYSGIIADVEQCLRGVRPDGRIHRVLAPGVVVVQSDWQHWPCLFPQHGPGRKHERPIVLEPWQERIVAEHPAAFLRGLFHSDGFRVDNWATRVVAGEKRRYRYGRWQFSNRSEDIHGLCTWALDLTGIAWRRSGRWTTSVSRREAVAALDRLIGPKS